MVTSSNGNIFRVTGITGHNRDASDLRRHRANYDIIVMTLPVWCKPGTVFFGFCTSDLVAISLWLYRVVEILFGKIYLKISYKDGETYYLLNKFVMNSYHDIIFLELQGHMCT